jgi:ABC-type Fe3+/spermidine/putrescine transport system ATPase subunit
LSNDDRLTVDVRKRLRDIELAVSLSFDLGVTLVVGPSGAGKTTLLRIIAGVVHPDAGTIALGGRAIDGPAGAHVPPGARDVGLVFQDYALFPHLDVAANVAYGLDARRVPRAERERRVREMLERLDIGELARVRPGALSGGQRQRVALARALVIEPRALLLDEPLAALDLLTRSRVREELVRLLRPLQIPTVFVTHDPADAAAFPERIVVLDAGAVVADAAHSDLDARASDFLGAFVGNGRL